MEYLLFEVLHVLVAQLGFQAVVLFFELGDYGIQALEFGFEFGESKHKI